MFPKEKKLNLPTEFLAVCYEHGLTRIVNYAEYRGRFEIDGIAYDTPGYADNEFVIEADGQRYLVTVTPYDGDVVE